MGISLSRSQLKGWNLSEGGQVISYLPQFHVAKAHSECSRALFLHLATIQKAEALKQSAAGKKKKKKNSASQITFSPVHSKDETFILEKASQEEKSYYHVKQESHSERSEPPPGHQIQISGVVFFTRETEFGHHNRKLR